MKPLILTVLSVLVCAPSSLRAQTEPDVDKRIDSVVKDIHTTMAAQRAAPESASAHIPWGVQRVNAPTAWKKTKGNVEICVVGSGIDRNIAALRVDGGYNVTAKNENFADDVGQGTSIAGVIASVAPEARFYAVKAINHEDNPSAISPGTIAAGILRCSDQGLRLINVIGTERQDTDKVLEKAVDYANAKGALVIAPASAGPYSHGVGLAYPARYAKVVAVSGSTASDKLLPEGNGNDDRYGFFADSGRNMSVLAPGDSVLTQEAGGRYIQITGSNAAAAYVTGLAALYLSIHPEATPDGIKQALSNAATPLKGLPADQQGGGMIDAGKLVAP